MSRRLMGSENVVTTREGTENKPFGILASGGGTVLTQWLQI